MDSRSTLAGPASFQLSGGRCKSGPPAPSFFSIHSAAGWFKGYRRTCTPEYTHKPMTRIAVAAQVPLFLLCSCFSSIRTARYAPYAPAFSPSVHRCTSTSTSTTTSPHLRAAFACIGSTAIYNCPLTCQLITLFKWVKFSRTEPSHRFIALFYPSLQQQNSSLFESSYKVRFIIPLCSNSTFRPLLAASLHASAPHPFIFPYYWISYATETEDKISLILSLILPVSVPSSPSSHIWPQLLGFPPRLQSSYCPQNTLPN